MKCLLLLLSGLNLSAATYYVATNGNNAADGSSGTPWLTIGKAITNAAAGDTVSIGPGEYSEWLTNITSGTADNPITFTGTRSGATWQTVLNPSTIVSNGWVAAPEIGSGVYKQTNMSFTTRELTITNSRVAFAYAIGDMASAINGGFATNWQTGAGAPLATPTTGAILLATATDVTVAVNGSDGPRIDFWSSVGAMYCSTGSICYLRLRDGTDPNGLLIRCAPNTGASADSTSIINPVVKLNGQSYLVYSNLMLRGAFAGFYIAGGNHNTIESNYLSGGYSRVSLDGGAYQNTISNNEIVNDYYGFKNPGAWDNDTSANGSQRASLYSIAKYLMGKSSSHDDAVKLLNAGNSNTITGNYFHSGLGVGVAINGDVTAPTYATEISSNTISQMPSIGILLSEGHTETKIFRNHLSDCNLNVRPHHWDTGNETNRVIYFYRNTAWLPDNIGDHFYFHFGANDGNPYWPFLWAYHNSFSGGKGLITASSYAPDQNGLSNVFFINNITSSNLYYSADFQDWTNGTVRFDFNYVTAPFPNYPSNTPIAPWFGANNITNTTALWVNAYGMSYTLPSNSAARDSGVDLTAAFTLYGSSWPALPVSADTRSGAAWDMGAIEFFGNVANVGTLNINGTLTIGQ